MRRRMLQQMNAGAAPPFNDGYPYLLWQKDKSFAETAPSGAIEIWTIEDLFAISNQDNNSAMMRDLDFNDDDSYANPANKSTYTTGNGVPQITLASGRVLFGQGHILKNTRKRETNPFFRFDGGAAGILDLGFVDIDFIGSNTMFEFPNAANGAFLKRCFTTGNMHVTGTGNRLSGGLVGFLGNTNPNLLEDNYSRVNVTSEGGTLIGGFVGWKRRSGTVQRNYYAGVYNIPNAGDSGTGLFFGLEEGGGTVQDNFADIDISDPLNNVGTATGLTSAQMKDQNNFTNFDFTNIWGIDT
jgi:hypothetical protein